VGSDVLPLEECRLLMPYVSVKPSDWRKASKRYRGSSLWACRHQDIVSSPEKGPRCGRRLVGIVDGTDVSFSKDLQP
jgi:hypothetical protein